MKKKFSCESSNRTRLKNYIRDVKKASSNFRIFMAFLSSATKMPECHAKERQKESKDESLNSIGKKYDWRGCMCIYTTILNSLCRYSTIDLPSPQQRSCCRVLGSLFCDTFSFTLRATHLPRCYSHPMKIATRIHCHPFHLYSIFLPTILRKPKSEKSFPRLFHPLTSFTSTTKATKTWNSLIFS